MSPVSKESKIVSYPSRANKMADKSFDLVHSDVCSCPQLSKLSFRYFVSFVDDYSRDMNIFVKISF